VPSPKGYRFYVNELMENRTLLPHEAEPLNRLLGRRVDELDRLLTEAGRLLANLTSYTALTLTPAVGHARFTRIELFLPEPNSLVCVIVTDTGAVRTKRFLLSRPGTDESARQLAAALNAVLSGHSDLTDQRLDEIACLAGEGARYLPAVSSFLSESVRQLSEREVFVSGASHLLEHPEFKQSSDARELMRYLSDGNGPSSLPEPPPDLGAQVFIGPENSAAALKDSSVVLASIPMGDGLSGIIGMVGPTRMDYRLLVSHLDYFTRRIRQLGDNNDKNEE
jgi:heat-inducible transcriptional repressor